MHTGFHCTPGTAQNTRISYLFIIIIHAKHFVWMLVLHPALQNDRALYSAIWHFGTARDQPRASFELTARVDGFCSILFCDFLRPSLYVKKGAIREFAHAPNCVGALRT